MTVNLRSAVRRSPACNQSHASRCPSAATGSGLPVGAANTKSGKLGAPAAGGSGAVLAAHAAHRAIQTMTPTRHACPASVVTSVGVLMGAAPPEDAAALAVARPRRLIRGRPA